MTPRRPPNLALTPGPIYRESFLLAANHKTTLAQIHDWIAREAAMIELHGPIVAELAYRKEVQEHEDATGLCVVCAGPRHDQDDF